MGTIRLNIDAVLMQSHEISNAKRAVADVKATVDSLRSQIDPKILARNSIGSRLKNVSVQLEDIRIRVSNIQGTVEAGASSYYSTDMNASQQAREIARGL